MDQVENDQHWMPMTIRHTILRLYALAGVASTKYRILYRTCDSGSLLSHLGSYIPYLCPRTQGTILSDLARGIVLVASTIVR